MAIEINITPYEENINQVEEYLKLNSGKNLSLRKIYRDLGMKRRKAIWMINNSEKIKNVNPLKVGCNKHFVHVYTFSE
jgi:hypothetical protein